MVKTKKAVKKINKIRRTGTKAKTNVVALILDESASMFDGIQDTISSVNEYLEGLKQLGGKTLVTLTKFNSHRMVSEVNVSADKVTKLNLDNYRPDGSTPLYDAVGKTVAGIKAPKNGKTLVVIVTDGQENDSKEFNREQIIEVIRKHEKAGWTFAYLGTGHDAFAAASSIGIKAGNTASYQRQNTQEAIRGLGSATMCLMTSSTKKTAQAFYSAEDRKIIEGSGN